MKNYNLRFNAEMEVSQIKVAVSEIQKYFNQISLPKGLASSFEKDLIRLREEFSKLESFKAKSLTGDLSPADANKIAKSYDVIFQKFGNLKDLLGELNNISGINPEKLFPSEIITKIEGATDAIKAYNSAISESKGSDEYKKIADEIAKAERQFKEYTTVKEKAEKSQSQASGRVSFLEEQVDKQKEIEKTAKEQAKIAEDEVAILKKQIEAKEKIAEITKKVQDLEKKNQTDKAIQAEREAKGKTNTKTYITTAADISSRKETINQLNQEKQSYEQLAQNAENAEKRIGEATRVAEERARAASQATRDLGKTMDSLGKERTNLALATADVQSNSEAAEQAKQSISNFGQELKALEEKAKSTALKALNSTLQELGVIGKEDSLSFDEIQTKIDSLKPDTIAAIKQKLEDAGISLEKFGINLGDLKGKADVFKETSEGVKATNSQLEMLKSRITYFFGLANSVQLFRQAVTKAMTAVKELDKAMTEIAVVTDFSVGDMWDKLPEYTENANELGVAVKDLYNATGLYYQQGLKGNRVMQMGIETMKMARIAGMDAADATKAMTAAVRGFNMEINETSAQRVNDVYSQLAAMTASDTEGIATAMSKTASIAYSANMELETTAALLAQIIETTQESPETAGTAMKTIIARFTEVKELFSEGQLTGKDTEGEEININRIDAALKTVGISLKDFLNGSKGIDDIFLELAQKWDTLDLATQRYIATAAAGSRQQSRFIAMMQDYDRTMELVTAANNSAGASQNQYEKTLESMETLLTKLKNAWQEFLTGIANNEVLKFGVKLLTGILNIANKLTGSLPGLVGSIAKLGLAWGSLKLGGAILEKGLKSIIDKTGLTKDTKDAVAAGQVEGNKKGVKTSIPSIWKDIKNAWYTAVKAGITQGTAEASATSVVTSKNNITGNAGKWVRGQESYDIFLDENGYRGKKYYSTNLENLSKRSKNSSKHSKILEDYDNWLKQKQSEEKKLLAQQQANVAQETTNVKKELILTNEKGEAVKIDGIASIEELKTAQDEKKTTFIEIAADEKEYEAAVIEYQKALSKKGIDNVHFSRVDKAAGQTDISARVVGSSKTGFKQGVTGIKSSAKQKWTQLTSGGEKWGLGSMLGGAVIGGILGNTLGKYIGKRLTGSNTSVEEALASAQSNYNAISNQFEEILDNLDGIKEAKNNFAALNKELKKSAKGSVEYTQALTKNNEAFFDMQEKFNFLENQSYYTYENGAYTITQQGWDAYNKQQTDELIRLSKEKQETSALLSSTKAEQQTLDYAEEVGIQTLEITAKEETRIQRASSGAGTIVGAIGGGLAAGALAGSLGGPIGAIVGGIVGAIGGLVSAVIAGDTAKKQAQQGISTEQIDSFALLAAKSGYSSSDQYQGEEWESFLKDAAMKIGLSLEELKTIVDADKEAFAEHTLTVQRNAAQQVAETTSIAETIADQLGLVGKNKEAYVATYTALYGDEDLELRKSRYENSVQFADKNATEKIDWEDLSIEDKDLVRQYAEIMGYIINEADPEHLFGDNIELPTGKEIEAEVEKYLMYKDMEEQALDLVNNYAEAMALGINAGVIKITDVYASELDNVVTELAKLESDIELKITNAWLKEFSSTYFEIGQSDLDFNKRKELTERVYTSEEPISQYYATLSEEEQKYIRTLQKIRNEEILQSDDVLNSLSALGLQIDSGATMDEVLAQIAEKYEIDYTQLKTYSDMYGVKEALSLMQAADADFSMEEFGQLSFLWKEYDNAEKRLVSSSVDTTEYIQHSREVQDSLANLLTGSVGQNTLTHILKDLTLGQQMQLENQLSIIPIDSRAEIVKQMDSLASSIGENFTEIVALGLDPEAIREYGQMLVETGEISYEQAGKIQNYALYLEKLNLGFSSLSIEQLTDRLQSLADMIDKINDVEIGEQLYLKEEEMNELVAMGVAQYSDFKLTTEGFVYEGEKELTEAIYELIAALGGSTSQIAENNKKFQNAWESTGLGSTWDSTSESYQISGVYDPKNTVHKALIENKVGSFIRNGKTTWEDIMNSDSFTISEKAIIADYYNQQVSNPGEYLYAPGFTKQDFQAGALWDKEKAEIYWNLLDETARDYFREINQLGEDEEVNFDQALMVDALQSFAANAFKNANFSEQSEEWGKQLAVDAMSSQDLYKNRNRFSYQEGEGNYADEELEERFKEVYSFGEQSGEFTKIYTAAFGDNIEVTQDMVNILKAHKLAAKESQKEIYKLCDAISENADEMDTLIEVYKEDKGTQNFSESQKETWDSVINQAKIAFGEGIDENFIAQYWDQFVKMAEGGDEGQVAFENISSALTESLISGYENAEQIRNTLTLLDGMDFSINGTADFTDIFNKLDAVIDDANLTAQILESMGYEVDYETVWYRLSDPSHMLYDNPTYTSSATDWASTRIVVGTKKDLSGYIGGGSSGSGGGSSSEWENPYDESYNTLRAINAELRERDRLEREYQHLLDKEGTSWKELLSNSYEFINNRKEEAALQEQLQQERKSQIESLVNENSEYSSYVTVDMNAGDFTIDWAAIEGLEGENLSEEEEAYRQGLEDYISALEDKFDSLYDAEESAAEALDDIRDYVADLQDEYLNAETMIKDAIVSSYQEQIDKLSEINDSINDANSKLLDAVQSSIDQMRQDRENEKTEQELSDKERRLAYLRQDTSGANALEILELEKELEEGRQDYTDSLVDQKISQLQDQNDYAAEQRQQQIDIMTSQLEWFQESGEIFGLVSNLMEGMYDENGKIDQTSVGWRLLESQAESMSQVGHMKWMEETENLLTQALVYLSLNGYNNNMAYDASTDYMAAMANTTSQSALAQLEQYRNYKIASQGRSEGMTYDYQDVAESEFDAFLKALGYNSLSDYITKFLVGQKGYEAYNSNTDYMAKMIAAVEAGDYVAAAVAEVYRNRKIEDLGLDIPKTYAFQKYLPKYKTGGIADFTGPAWLDGTKSRPEMVLNQRDTQNFIQLKDILSGLLGHGNFNSSETNGDVYYNIDINVERISSDYDIDEVVNKIKQTIYEDASYRNVNAIHLIR